MNLTRMIKGNAILVIFLFLPTIFYGQLPSVEQCGLDDNANINKYEAAYFNAVFESKRDTFDFTNKKVAFVMGSGLENFQNKNYYFSNVKGDSISDSDHIRQANYTQVMILTPDEKELSGGYDVILIIWAKFLVEEKRRARMVKNLGNSK